MTATVADEPPAGRCCEGGGRDGDGDPESVVLRARPHRLPRPGRMPFGRGEPFCE